MYGLPRGFERASACGGCPTCGNDSDLCLVMFGEDGVLLAWICDASRTEWRTMFGGWLNFGPEVESGLERDVFEALGDELWYLPLDYCSSDAGDSGGGPQ